MAFALLFEKRFRGFRVVEIVALACLIALVFAVYFSKAHAGRESAEITDVDGQITQTQHRLRLLQAEVAHLESPARMEALAQQYLGLAPIAAKHETEPGGLMEVARAAAEPAPAGKAAPGAPAAPHPAPPVKTAAAAPVPGRTTGAPL